MRQEENFRRLSQSIVDAARPSTDGQAKASQEAAALVVNSIGQMVQPKRATRKYAFDEAIDLVANGFKAAREARADRVRENRETDKERQEAKTLAQLLTESAQDSE